MRSRPCAPDSIVYNAIIDVLWETGVGWAQRRAVALFQQVGGGGPSPAGFLNSRPRACSFFLFFLGRGGGRAKGVLRERGCWLLYPWSGTTRTTCFTRQTLCSCFFHTSLCTFCTSLLGPPSHVCSAGVPRGPDPPALPRLLRLHRAHPALHHRRRGAAVATLLAAGAAVRGAGRWEAGKGGWRGAGGGRKGRRAGRRRSTCRGLKQGGGVHVSAIAVVAAPTSQPHFRGRRLSPYRSVQRAAGSPWQAGWQQAIALVSNVLHHCRPCPS